MPAPNSRIDIRISNPEKDQWAACADSMGLTLTQLIKQSVRSAVSSHAPPQQQLAAVPLIMASYEKHFDDDAA